MAEPAVPAEDRTRFANNIRAQSQRMQELIDRLLSLSRIEARGAAALQGRFEPAAVIQAAVAERSAGAAQRGVTIVAELAAAPTLLVGDAELVQLAVGNLLDNALDFAPAGSEVTLTAVRDTATLEIRVRDHGPGIPDYALPRVFERFYSLPRPDGRQRGSGLGLAFVREIAELHRGAASIENDPAGGVLARIRLPCA